MFMWRRCSKPMESRKEEQTQKKKKEEQNKNKLKPCSEIMTANLNRAGSNTGICCCWQRWGKKTTRKEEPLSYDKPNVQTVLKFTVVFVCDTAKKSKQNPRVENNKNGTGVTEKSLITGRTLHAWKPIVSPPPPHSLLYIEQLLRFWLCAGIHL